MKLPQDEFSPRKVTFNEGGAVATEWIDTEKVKQGGEYQGPVKKTWPAPRHPDMDKIAGEYRNHLARMYGHTGDKKMNDFGNLIEIISVTWVIKDFGGEKKTGIIITGKKKLDDRKDKRTVPVQSYEIREGDKVYDKWDEILDISERLRIELYQYLFYQKYEMPVLDFAQPGIQSEAALGLGKTGS